MSKNVAYNADLNGFIPFERYYFEFSGLGGNWPSVVSPASGYFTTNKDGQYQLSANVAFCASTGVSDCNPSADGYLSYNINSLTDLNLYTSLQLNVSDSSDSNVLSQVDKVMCEGCRPSVEIHTPHFVNLLKSNDGKADFNVHIDGLEIGEEYTYEIISIFGNWPMYVTPKTGSFKSYEQHKTLTFTVDPCETDTGCSSGHLLYNYTLDDRDNYYSGFKFVLTDSNGVSEYGSIVEAICNDCLPDTPEIVTVKNAVLSSVNSDTHTRNVDILNLSDGQTYYYVVENIHTDSPVIIYPQSGTIASKTNSSFELDVVFCSSAAECAFSDHYIASNSQGDNYLGVQPKDLTFDISLYRNLNGSAYNDLVTSINNVKTTCDGCIKIPQVVLNQNAEELVLSDNNNINITASLSNLEIGKKYKYTINNNSSTWPVELSRVSGEFTAKSNTKNLSSNVKFCSATGICDDPGFDPADVDAGYKHVMFSLTLESLNTDIENVVSDNLMILCDDCIPEHQIGRISSTIYPNTYDNENVTLIDNDYDFNMRFRGLVVGESYQYTINVNDSNWPIYLKKPSGTFVANAASVNISNMLELCPTSNGDCSTLGNTISEVSNVSTKLNDIFVDMNINLSGINPELDVNLDSHDIRVSCPSCLPFISIDIENTPLTTAASSFINVNLDGLHPNREYYYIFNSGDTGSWPFSVSSLSGYFTPSSTSHVMSLPYSAVAVTGMGDYDASKTLPYTYSKYETLKYKNLSITVGSYDADINSKTSRDFQLVCDDCFPDPNTQNLSIESLIFNNNEIYTVNFNVNAIVPGYKYGYEITSVDSNWPYKILNDSTGVLLPANNNDNTISVQFEFCAVSGGNCFNDRFNTDIIDANDIAAPYENISNTLRIAFSGLENEPLITNQATNKFTLSCNTSRDCLFSLSNITPVIDSTNLTDTHIVRLGALNSISSNDISNNTFYYQINGSELNWPVAIDNASGYIMGDEDLLLEFAFCPTTSGQCAHSTDHYIFDYDHQDLCLDNTIKTGTFDVYYSGVDLEIPPVNSSDFTLSCAYSNLKTIQVDAGVDNISAANSMQDLFFDISSIAYNTTYLYRFTVDDANWPMYLSDYSGTFTTTNTSNIHTLSTTLGFCNRSDGSCASNVDNDALIDYTLDGQMPSANVYLTVTPIDDSSSGYDLAACDIRSGTSEQVKVSCDNCLDNISFVEVNDVILSSSDFFTLDLDLSLSNNFNIEDSYYYEIRLKESNWPITVKNISGTVSDTNLISSIFTFCPTSSGQCSSGANTFAANLVDCNVRSNDKYGVFDILVSGSGLDLDNAVSNEFTITCPSELLNSISIDSTTSDVWTLDSIIGNRINLSYDIGNLTAGETYNYNISSIDADWPFKILSGNNGQFTASATDYTLKLVGQFCPTTSGDCSSGAMDYTAKEFCFMTYQDANNPVYGLGLDINVWATGCEIADGHNNLTRISCANCLNNISIVKPQDITLVDTNYQPLYFTINGLKDGKTYNYKINCDNANWPISMTPQTGTLEADGSTFNFQSSMMFCYPSGICADQDNVGQYAEYSYYDKITKGTALRAEMSLTVTPSDVCEEISITSDKVNVVCENCLPAFSYASIVMSGSPEISLPESCCTGYLPIYVNVTDAVPGEAYTYNFSASSDNIAFNPVSGTAYFDGTGSGTLITTVESQLDLYGMSIIQCELTHNNTNEKVIDMISMKCGESCPLQ